MYNPRAARQTGRNSASQTQATTAPQATTQTASQSQGVLGLFGGNNAQPQQQKNVSQTIDLNDPSRNQIADGRQSRQERQTRLAENKLANEAQQSTASQALRAKTASKNLTEQTYRAQQTRSLDAEQQLRSQQAAVEIARFDRERNTAITNAVRSSETLPRGSIINVLG